MAWVERRGGYRVTWQSNARRTYRKTFVRRREAEALCRHVSGEIKAVPTSYRVAWRTPDGQVHKEGSFRRRADAETRRKQLDGEHVKGLFLDPARARMTLSELWAEWLPTARTRAGAELSPNTRWKWEQVWRRYLEPALGHRALVTIRRSDVEALSASIASDRQRSITVGLLRLLLYRAMNEGAIATNPAARPGLSQERATEPEIATAAELDAIAKAVPRRYRALVLVTAYGSLRPSEAFALRMGDIDFKGARIRIDQRTVEIPGGVHTGRTKTKASQRWVTLPRFVMKELAAHLRSFPPGEDGLVFTTETGPVIRATSFGKRIWRPALERAKINRPLHFMNLRHSGASLVHDAGFGERDISDRLGHTSTRMAGRYVQVYADRQRAIALALGRKPARGAASRPKDGGDS